MKQEFIGKKKHSLLYQEEKQLLSCFCSSSFYSSSSPSSFFFTSSSSTSSFFFSSSSMLIFYSTTMKAMCCNSSYVVEMEFSLLEYILTSFQKLHKCITKKSIFCILMTQAFSAGDVMRHMTRDSIPNYSESVLKTLLLCNVFVMI